MVKVILGLHIKDLSILLLESRVEIGQTLIEVLVTKQREEQEKR